ncbi:succinyl-diaminopimelate desuccinylase [Candidatus Kinetoplastibacterium blastocrithidii TCC012E]|uniref:Succinyl-diaminopimelate desuccinylase n=1 Tax=Candidatus Kinetoplastidibacterium blastocrithidiae TCC012E TaxID=1208922 RepID=M1M040_9PROT|nr:succinyl-diaminopimelate desuccinylase [Candidatus Kinetoplastibacterium blastocrithidii]AFZ83552.1 succinyl-diaminopimelate desuccinylase [Candidatus Kinetoplastibacterium blastocrithidii (ex Strigomonas culicis)]AGF49671.1 succinyl-diaminopimelate desuccinylase [Candidatus Kinetoplastibacterium blastocrithidii TCC012E]
MSKKLSVIDIANDLVSLKSITPDDAGCQKIISDILVDIGFKCTSINKNGVTNLWAIKGKKNPLFVFAGHTDVVPAGNIKEWNSDPFIPTERDGYIYGRGISDMKGSIAAFLVAANEFIEEYPEHTGSIALLITSDEEGDAIYGTSLVCEHLRRNDISIDFCIVGEPTSEKKLGDVCKNGRRGSLSGNLIIKGTQGHVAYPHLAFNPIHSFSPALSEIINYTWDKGNEHFPPTTFQISNIHSGNGATNVIPGEMEIKFNFRFSTENTPENLKRIIHSILDKYKLKYKLEWVLNGEPFITQNGSLINAITESIFDETKIKTKLSTSGGTSDGRFITKVSKQIIEFGPCNDSIHKVNERVEISSLNILKNIYRSTLEKLLLI